MVATSGDRRSRVNNAETLRKDGVDTVGAAGTGGGGGRRVSVGLTFTATSVARTGSFLLFLLLDRADDVGSLLLILRMMRSLMLDDSTGSNGGGEEEDELD